MTVIHDRPDELALLRQPGYPMKRRNAEIAAGPARFRHPGVSRWLTGWSDDPPWQRGRVVVLKQPGSGHAISLFWDDASGSFDFWYIDLIGPVRRRSFGFDFPDHGLDIVVEPDLSRWRWKDDDELEWSVDRGLYTRTEANALYAEGRRAVEGLIADRPRYEHWIDWRPDPAWPVARLPDGWDAV